MREKVWDKLAKHIPPNTKTLYLTADGDLARMPWAALPIDKDRVLLEEYAIALVPHGTFLLDHLKSPRTFPVAESLFALGGVDYGLEIWPALPGTAVEVQAITALAHHAGALMLWDLSHSAGALPVELNACNVDLAVGCTYKYLNGGPGAPAFLYIRRDLQDQLLSPIWGWFSRAKQAGNLAICR